MANRGTWVIGCWILLVFTLGGSLSAQDVTVSREIRLNTKMPRFKLLGKTGAGYAALRYGESQLVFDLYNHRLNLQRSQTVKLNQAIYEDAFVDAEGGWVLLHRPTKDSSTLSAVRLNAEMQLQNEINLALDAVPQSRRSPDGRYKVYQSEYGNAYVVLRSASNSSQLEQVALYNQHFEHISTFPITLSREDRFNQILITQTGDVYLLFTENSERPKPYIVYLASEGSASPVRYNVPMESFPYHPGKIKYDARQDKLIFACLYSDRREDENYGATGLIHGYFDGQNWDLEEEDFSHNMLTDLTGQALRQSDNRLKTYYVNRIIPSALDSSYTLLMESFYSEEEQVFVPSVFATTTLSNYRTVELYYYNDIIALQRSPYYEVEDYTILRKSQLSENDNGRYSGIFLMNRRQELCLLYADAITLDGNYNRFVLTGENVAKESLFNLGQKEVLPLTKLAQQTAVNECIMPSYVNNKMKLLKIAWF
ncbi:MAG: hypothetical protein ACPGGH_08435 [Chitinophagales bacterium]